MVHTVGKGSSQYTPVETVQLKQAGRQINQIVQNWLQSSQQLSMIRDSDIIVSGGCLPSIIHGDVVNDWDIYFTNDVIKNRVLDFYKGTGLRYVKMFSKNYAGITDNAITLKKNNMQLIIRDTGVPQDIVKTFDYLHPQWYWQLEDKKLYITRRILNTINNKQLVVTNPKRFSSKRETKFVQRGWFVVKDDMYKKAMDIHIPF